MRLWGLSEAGDFVEHRFMRKIAIVAGSVVAAVLVGGGVFFALQSGGSDSSATDGATPDPTVAVQGTSVVAPTTSTVAPAPSTVAPTTATAAPTRRVVVVETVTPSAPSTTSTTAAPAPTTTTLPPVATGTGTPTVLSIGKSTGVQSTPGVTVVRSLDEAKAFFGTGTVPAGITSQQFDRVSLVLTVPDPTTERVGCLFLGQAWSITTNALTVQPLVGCYGGLDLTPNPNEVRVLAFPMPKAILAPVTRASLK